MTDPVVQTHALTKRFGRITAVNELDFQVEQGQTYGILGPNGSGKTTLIRAVSGVVAPQDGGIRLDGSDALGLSAREMALRVAVVPQNPHLPPAFTALELVLMGRTPHLGLLQGEGQADLEAARRAMLATETWELADRPIGELSGGERQRVLVARALAQETPLLLLDEPTAHLDIGHQAATLRLMARLCRSEGKAVLAAVHDLTLAAQFCHRLLMLHQGRVVAEGGPRQVLTPERLRQVYGASVHVLSHPVTGRPVLAPDGDAG